MTKHYKQVLCCMVLMMCLCVARAQADTTNQTPRKPFIPRTMDWGYRIIEGDSAHPRKQYVLPVPIISYKPETRWILGISIATIFRVSKDSTTRPSSARLNVSYSQNQQFSIRPAVDIFTKHNKWNIKAAYQFTNFAENFWGIGRNSLESNKELYSFSQQKVTIKVAHQLIPHMYFGGQYAFENLYHVDAVPGGFFESSNLIGGTGYRVSGAGITAYYDNRDHIYYPLHGQFIELSNLFYGETIGSHYTFSNITLDARKYIHLWKNNVLAVQGFASINQGTIPFRDMGVIGSDVFMRGYYNGRFRDNHAMAFQAELRKTIWGPVGCVIWAGGGTVANTTSDLFNGIKPNYGIGLRVKAIPRERVNVRIDYGFGEAGIQALYVGLYEAF